MKFKLSDICDLRSGFQGKTTEGTGYQQIRLINVTKEGILDYEALETFDSAKVADKYLLKKGDVIIKAKSGDHTAALVDREMNNLVATSHFILMSLKDKYQALIDPQYLVMYLNSQGIQQYFRKHGSNMALPILKISTLELLEIIIPDIEEQKRLSSIYSLMIEEKKLMQQLMIQREKQVEARLKQVIRKEQEEWGRN